MPDLEDVRQFALALPETAERASYGGAPAWTVRGKGFVWQRPLRKADLDALRGSAPAGLVLGVVVPDEGAKQALLAEEDWALTTPHVDGYPIVLVDLERVSQQVLQELVVEAWLVKAPQRLAAQYGDES